MLFSILFTELIYKWINYFYVLFVELPQVNDLRPVAVSFFSFSDDKISVDFL